MSFGWFLDGLDSASAGFSVLDSFVCTPFEGINKSYSSDVLKFASHINLFITPSGVTNDYDLYAYPALTASLDKANGLASVIGPGGGTWFLVVVFIR
jgi:hypothetical protein